MAQTNTVNCFYQCFFGDIFDNQITYYVFIKKTSEFLDKNSWISMQINELIYEKKKSKESS